MAHTIYIKVDLLHRALCNNCLCVLSAQEHSKCSKGYWDSRKGSRQFMWWNSCTDELQEESDTDHGHFRKDGWAFCVRRPQKCIDEVERGIRYSTIRIPNCITLVNAADFGTRFEDFVNQLSGRSVKAKRMSHKFTITNDQGYERDGDPGDWLVEEDGKLYISWDETFKGNFAKEE